MSKEKILEILRQRDDFVSGQKLADDLLVSRNSIWKYIKALQEEGYEISSQTRLGYRLDKTTERLSPAEIIRLTGLPQDRLIALQEIDSTNTYLKTHQEGLADRTTVVTDHQTMGRGRFGRSFYSPKGSGLYFSVLYKGSAMPDPEFLTMAAALAVADVLSDLGLKPWIKWVNDVYVDERKISGILTEGEVELESGSMKYLILGIGINVNNEEFPDDLKDSASSLKLCAGRAFNLNEVCAALLKSLECYASQLVRRPGQEEVYRRAVEDLLARYNDKLLFKGETVILTGGNRPDIIGSLRGTDEHGHLMIQTAEGLRTAVYGEYRLSNSVKRGNQ